MDMNSLACNSSGTFCLDHHIRAAQLSAQILTTVYKANKPAGGEEVQNDMQKVLFGETKQLCSKKQNIDLDDNLHRFYFYYALPSMTLNKVVQTWNCT